MNINSINSTPAFKGFVNIVGDNSTVKMVNTSRITGVDVDPYFTEDNSRIYANCLYYLDSEGDELCMEGSHKSHDTKDATYKKLADYVAKTCAEADATGKVLDIVL